MNSEKQKKLINYFYPQKKKHPLPLLLSQMIEKQSVVLDAGCGNGLSFNYAIKGKARLLIGVDLQIEDIGENQNIQCSSVATLEHLPIQSGSVDLIFSRDVFEHLRSPQDVLDELVRILKPGGKLLIQTPNNSHYFAILSHLVPFSVQRLIAKRILHHTDEVFRTYYRCNSKSRMEKLARKAGFNSIDFHFFEPRPTFMAFSPVFFLPAVVYERLVTRYACLSKFRAQIVGILQKSW